MIPQFGTAKVINDKITMGLAVTANGGALPREPFDVGGVGRMAACADPQGAPFMLMAMSG